MFVKVICNKVVRSDEGIVQKRGLDYERVYECRKVHQEPVQLEPSIKETPTRTGMILSLNTHDPDEITTIITKGDPHYETQVIYMNNQGKTIDRYIY